MSDLVGVFRELTSVAFRSMLPRFYWSGANSGANLSFKQSSKAVA
jgi:hypothetical protein